MTNAVGFENIIKRFLGVVANDDISLAIPRNEIHSLLGENGSGKTTLMNILYGLYRLDSGRIYVDEQPVQINSPQEAIAHGIGMVHQHFMLVPVYTVAENIILGQRLKREPLLDLSSAEQSISDISRSYGLGVDPRAEVSQLSVGEQQRVEIVKALFRNAKILILDEPTSVLTPSEADELFVVLRRLKEEGRTIIFITHKLKEVMNIADRVTVLRGGRVVDTVSAKDVNEASLVRMMVGREVFFQVDKSIARPRGVALELDNVSVSNDKGKLALKNVSFVVEKGEIIGMAGVDGNGQVELEETILGLRTVDSGDVRICNQSTLKLRPDEIIKRGVASIPSDRERTGIIGAFTISENLLLKGWNDPRFSNHTFLDLKKIREYSENLMQDYDIRAPRSSTVVGHLSGGNKQKAVLARELASKPIVLVACQPTRGLDVGATEYIRQRILLERDRGAAVLLISADLDEILALSDRIMVLFNGEIMGSVDSDHINMEEIALMMTGWRAKDLENHESVNVAFRGNSL